MSVGLSVCRKNSNVKFQVVVCGKFLDKQCKTLIYKFFKLYTLNGSSRNKKGQENKHLLSSCLWQIENLRSNYTRSFCIVVSCICLKKNQTRSGREAS